MYFSKLVTFIDGLCFLVFSKSILENLILSLGLKIPEIQKLWK